MTKREGKEEKKRIKKKRYYEKNKEKMILKSKDRYYRLKEKRICPGCLEKLEDDYKFIKCEKCRELGNLKRRMNYDPKERSKKYTRLKEN